MKIFLIILGVFVYLICGFVLAKVLKLEDGTPKTDDPISWIGYYLLYGVYVLFWPVALIVMALLFICLIPKTIVDWIWDIHRKEE